MTQQLGTKNHTKKTQKNKKRKTRKQQHLDTLIQLQLISVIPFSRKAAAAECIFR